MNTLYELLRANYTSDYFNDLMHEYISIDQLSSIEDDLKSEKIDAYVRVGQIQMLFHLMTYYIDQENGGKLSSNYRLNPEFADLLLNKVKSHKIKVSHVPWEDLCDRFIYIDCTRPIDIFGGDDLDYLVTHIERKPGGGYTLSHVCAHKNNKAKKHRMDIDLGKIGYKCIPHQFHLSPEYLDMDLNEVCHDISEVRSRNLSDTFKQQVDLSIIQPEFLKSFTSRYLGSICKLLIYLTSGDPDIRLIKGTKKIPEIKNKKAVQKFMRKKKDNYAHDVIHVGFEYMKNRLYHKDKTYKDTFPRLQPCGPGRSEVKLVWVRGHEVHYKNTYNKVLANQTTQSTVVV